MAQEKSISVDEITKHNTPEDCWIVVDNIIWDITSFAGEHPGGSGIIYQHAGRDASISYNSIHGPSLLPETLGQSARKGQVDKSTVTPDFAKPPPEATPELALNEKPPLETIINSFDLEAVAERFLTKKTWAFYSSAATDNVTRDQNQEMFRRIFFRPRLFQNVGTVNTSSKIMDWPCDMPLFVSPAALAKLVHEEGECAIARACAKEGIIQSISNNSSFSAQDVIDATNTTTPLTQSPRFPLQPFIFQLYLNKDRSKTVTLLKNMLSTHADRLLSIWVTIDAPVPGKREPDERLKADASIGSPNSGAKASNDAKGGGLGRIMGSYIDASASWSDVDWLYGVLASLPHNTAVSSSNNPRPAKRPIPIVLKGIQTAMDAACAASHPHISGIVVSNHGGRSLDTSPPAILTLLEIRVRCPWVFDRVEVYIDSGVRRGTDIVKCLALGARACGLGRPALYGLTYGEEGVRKLVQLLKDEVETTMRLTGVTRLDPDAGQVGGWMVNTRGLEGLVPDAEKVLKEGWGSWLRSRL